MLTYLISGCGKGIGFSLLKVAILRENRVIALVRSEEDAFNIVENFGSSKVLPVLVDLRDNKLESEISASIEEFGGVVDVLINNAGIGGSGKSLLQSDPNLVLSLFENNCLGAFRLSKYSLPYLQQSESAQILNIISRFALPEVLVNSEMAVSYAYALSKGALHQLSVLMSRDRSLSKILTYSVDPGPTKTRMAREDATKEPDEVASLIINLTENLDWKRSGKVVLVQD